MIGIYCIRHIASGKRYIGKSSNIKRRFTIHKHLLSKKVRSLKSTNRYLYNAVQKYGWASFEKEIVELFDKIDENVLAEREIYWMDHYKTTDPRFGYNLRYDSSTSMIVHPLTKTLQSKLNKGEGNPNYGNKWTEEAKRRMSLIKKKQHKSGEIYNEKWRRKQGETSSRFWKENPDRIPIMAAKVSEKKKKYDFIQLTEEGTVIRRWESIEEIIRENPDYKWQNIYSVCNGYKKRIYGFKWRKVLKNEN